MIHYFASFVIHALEVVLSEHCLLIAHPLTRRQSEAATAIRFPGRLGRISLLRAAGLFSVQRSREAGRDGKARARDTAQGWECTFDV